MLVVLDLAELGLEPGAGLAEVNARFRALARVHHPDVGGDGARMAKLNATVARVRAALGEDEGAR